MQVISVMVLVDHLHPVFLPQFFLRFLYLDEFNMSFVQLMIRETGPMRHWSHSAVCSSSFRGYLERGLGDWGWRR